MDDDLDDQKDPQARAARQRERDRMSAIMLSPSGRRWPQLAAVAAFMTALPRHAAIKLVEELGAIGTADQPAAAQSLADKILEAGRRARSGEILPMPAAAPDDPSYIATPGRIIAAGIKRRAED